MGGGTKGVTYPCAWDPSPAKKSSIQDHGRWDHGGDLSARQIMSLCEVLFSSLYLCMITACVGLGSGQLSLPVDSG